MPEELTFTQIKDLQFASSKMTGVRRRAFQAEIAIKYCEGSARLTEYVFGWGRNTVATGLAEKRTGIICVGAQSGFSGRKRWEELHPKAAAALGELAEAHCQQEPTFSSSIAFTRLTAAAAIDHLQQQGFCPEQLPSASVMAAVLNRSGYRLRKILKAKPKKNCHKQMPSLPTFNAKTTKSMTAHSSD
ncbi:MAG: transposase [Acaryochloris sp. CRU_2_0]|nr:transposase [Acaryochloris sp. CRU_2_0]